jgi:hypothetical protein
MSSHEHAHVIGNDLQGQFLTAGGDPAREAGPPVPRAPRDVITELVYPTSGHLHLPGHAGDYTHDLCQTTRFPCDLKTALPSRGV